MSDKIPAQSATVSTATMTALGRVVHARTYARRVDGGRRMESWEETCARVVASCNTQLRVGLDDEESGELYALLRDLKCSVAGRFMWQLGTKVVDKYGLLSLQNCAFAVVEGGPSPYKTFQWIFDCLMLGVGVGVRISRKEVSTLPPMRKVDGLRRVDAKDADVIVPDTREGWVALIGKVLKAHFYTGKGFTYSLQLIRSAGEPIHAFGGVASGPRPLCEGIHKINQVINKRVAEWEAHSGETQVQLTPVNVMDVIALIGRIVVSGNVRRSALIMLGDADDAEYLKAKDWGSGAVPNWRAHSNNSVLCDDVRSLPEEFWQGYAGNGEPYGLVNIPLMRRCGRTGDERYPDENVQGCNPCAEQTLEHFETCCLAEIFLPNISSAEELEKCATMLYRINKHSLALPCHWSATEEVVHRNMRMGISVSGVAQASEEQLSWLPKAYERLREFDAAYSALHGFPASRKLTTVKPSGTLSLLGNTTPGIHPAYSQFYIRRVRFSADSHLLPHLRGAGYKSEFAVNFDGTEDVGTVIVEFPVATPRGTILAEEMSAVKQLELVSRLQREWSDNAVSVTVTYRKDELPAIRAWLEENYSGNIKAVSFLLHSGHGFAQAPIEPITEEVYRVMQSRVRPLPSLSGVDEDDDIVDLECVSGTCPVR